MAGVGPLSILKVANRRSFADAMDALARASRSARTVHDPPNGEASTKERPDGTFTEPTRAYPAPTVRKRSR